MSDAVTEPVIAPPPWHATLRLEFMAEGGRSVLRRNPGFGPLYVQKPFYPEGDDVCHVYLLHPPGGVAAHDRLTTEISVNSGAHALVTTPAATKLYRSDGERAELQQQLRVGAGGALEWLPQETLVFDGAHAVQTTTVMLDHNSRYLGWDCLCLGRPGAGEPWRRGRFDQRLDLWMSHEGDQQLLLRDWSTWTAGADVLAARWGWQECPVLATVHACPVDEEQVDWLREQLDPASGFALTLRGPVLIARVLTDGPQRARQAFEPLWRVLRPMLFGKGARIPAIWRC